MSTGKGIAIPTPRKPIQAISKFTLVLDGDPTGVHLSVRGANKQVVRYAIQTGGYVLGAGASGDPEPQPEPETRATTTRKPMSAATKAKLAEAAKKRHRSVSLTPTARAELRKTQEGASETTTSAPTGKRKPKTMTAGSTA